MKKTLALTSEWALCHISAALHQAHDKMKRRCLKGVSGGLEKNALPLIKL